MAFVPLIGEEGWAEPERAKEAEIDVRALGLCRRAAPAGEAGADDPESPEPADGGRCQALRRSARALDTRRALRRPPRDPARRGNPRHGRVLSGARDITEMLVDRHGFNIVAVEADWPDAAVYDAYVRDLPRPKVPKSAFTRFPTWMWRNGQVAEFLNRLKEINASIGDPDRKAGFHGLDIYSLGASIEAVLHYLDKVDADAARVARERYGCLVPWRAEPARYGRMALSRGYAVCEKPVADALTDLLRKRLVYLARDGACFLRRRAECARRCRRRTILPRHLLRRCGIVEFA